jgi:hypothetical protein
MKDNPFVDKCIAQSKLIELYEQQLVDLSMLSKIELGDDVIAEIIRLKADINIV